MLVEMLTLDVWEMSLITKVESHLDIFTISGLENVKIVPRYDTGTSFSVQPIPDGRLHPPVGSSSEPIWLSSFFRF